MMNNARNNPSQQRPNMGRPGPRGVMFREKPKNKKKMIKRLIGYLGSYWKSLIALLLVMVVVSITALGSSIVQKYVIDAIAAKDKNGFYLYLFVLSIIYIVSVCMAFFRGIISANLSQKTVYKLRKDLFGKMVYLPISYFDKNSHGDIMSRMTNDVDAISNAISQGISFFISAILNNTSPLCLTPNKSPPPLNLKSSSLIRKPSLVFSIIFNLSLSLLPINTQYEVNSFLPTLPLNWCNVDIPNKFALCITIIVAFLTSTPTSITVVLINISISLFKNLFITSSFSLDFILP